jgi:MFS transporter, DHA1 family, inner membrane transport protein
VGAVAMGAAAPLLAGLLGGFDRRRLLTLALLWYALGHALSALMPSLATLLPMRVLCVLGAAVFSPQAAAAINVMAPPGQRGRAMTTVFLGWSLASVLGMPINGLVAETVGWRWAFLLVAALSLVAAVAVWRTVPDGVKPPPLSLKNWGQVFGSPLLMGLVGVTVFSAAGQFTLFSYLAPYYKQVMGADATGVTLLFFSFGAFGLIGNLLLTRQIDRRGAAYCVNLGVGLIALSMLLWPLSQLLAGLPGGLLLLALLMVPWALGCFSSNSAQQARLSQAAPALAPAMLALNTSAMYVGQALGAGSGGFLLAAGGFGTLNWAGLMWLLASLCLSLLLARRMRGGRG